VVLQPRQQLVGPAVVAVGGGAAAVGQGVADDRDRRGVLAAFGLDAAEEVPVVGGRRVRQVGGLGLVAVHQVGGGARAGVPGEVERGQTVGEVGRHGQV